MADLHPPGLAILHFHRRPAPLHPNHHADRGDPLPTAQSRAHKVTAERSLCDGCSDISSVPPMPSSHLLLAKSPPQRAVSHTEEGVLCCHQTVSVPSSISGLGHQSGATYTTSTCHPKC